MRKFILKIYKFINNLQNKFSPAPKEAFSGSSSSGKSHISATETMHLNAKEKEITQEIKQKAKALFKENLETPEKIFEYIQNQGTSIIITPLAPLVLWLIREQEGLILPQKNLKGLILNILLNIFNSQKTQLSCKSPAIFFIKNERMNPYILAYHLYHWFAFTSKLSGYDSKAIKNLKDISRAENIMQSRTLPLNEILSVKEVIARDVEALDMVGELTKEVASSKRANEKLKTEGKISI